MPYCFVLLNEMPMPHGGVDCGSQRKVGSEGAKRNSTKSNNQTKPRPPTPNQRSEMAFSLFKFRNSSGCNAKTPKYATFLGCCKWSTGGAMSVGAPTAETAHCAFLRRNTSQADLSAAHMRPFPPGHPQQPPPAARARARGVVPVRTGGFLSALTGP